MICQQEAKGVGLCSFEEGTISGRKEVQTDA